MASQLYAKEELRRHSIPDKLMSFQEKCDTDFFELAPHQLFLKNFFSPNTPYQSLLLFHGVGVGKSCSGISIAENFRCPTCKFVSISDSNTPISNEIYELILKMVTEGKTDEEWAEIVEDGDQKDQDAEWAQIVANV